MAFSGYKHMVPVTDDDSIYICDNGECLCGRHLGTSARYTGCDISGQEILKVTPYDVKYMREQFGMTPECERCGKKAKMLVAVE